MHFYTKLKLIRIFWKFILASTTKIIEKQAANTNSKVARKVLMILVALGCKWSLCTPTLLGVQVYRYYCQWQKLKFLWPLQAPQSTNKGKVIEDSGKVFSH